MPGCAVSASVTHNTTLEGSPGSDLLDLETRDATSPPPTSSPAPCWWAALLPEECGGDVDRLSDKGIWLVALSAIAILLASALLQRRRDRAALLQAQDPMGAAYEMTQNEAAMRAARGRGWSLPRSPAELATPPPSR